MKKLHKLFYIISMVGIVVTIVSLLCAGYMIFWPMKVVKYQTTLLPILNKDKQVKPGEFLEYEVSYCRYTDRQARITRELIDGVVYTLPEIYSRLEEGCHTVVMQRETIPNIPNGKYTLLLTAEFKMNPLRTITYTLRTEPFFVVR